ncbi:MAG TPA: hypothetical protein V6D05_15230 [Stenomitos sp.]
MPDRITLSSSFSQDEVLNRLRAATIASYDFMAINKNPFYGAVSEGTFDIRLNKPRAVSIIAKGKICPTSTGTDIDIRFLPTQMSQMMLVAYLALPIVLAMLMLSSGAIGGLIIPAVIASASLLFSWMGKNTEINDFLSILRDTLGAR